MVTVVYRVTQLCLQGYRRARCPLEIKASAQTSFPAGFATGLSLVHLNAPEKRTQEDVAGRTVSPPVCQPFSGSRKEQGRQPAVCRAPGNVSADAAVHRDQGAKKESCAGSALTPPRRGGGGQGWTGTTG